MGRARPNTVQNFLAGVCLPVCLVSLLPVSLFAVFLSLAKAWYTNHLSRIPSDRQVSKNGQCVIISGGKMSKGLALARGFKRAGWTVVGVEEEGIGSICPMRFSRAVDLFHTLPSPTHSVDRYSQALCDIAIQHKATIFLPVSGVASSIEDALIADAISRATQGNCRTFIQDKETMEDLHDKDRFMLLLDRLDITRPQGEKVNSIDEAIKFMRRVDMSSGTRYILKCMGIDENRGDMTLYPIDGDDAKRTSTEMSLRKLKLLISKTNPYVFQQFIPGQEWCTHASVIDGRLTSFVACPSNDMLLCYEDVTRDVIGQRMEKWTKTFLSRLQKDSEAGKARNLTGHFSFDFISSDIDKQLYPLECNARVHTAIILLPLDHLAGCYSQSTSGPVTLYPDSHILPRSWIYNDLLTRYLPSLIPSRKVLSLLHPSLPGCLEASNRVSRPDESPFAVSVDPTLVADDWLPFLVFWHLWWPVVLLFKWWHGKRWTRLNVSTGRIFEA